MNVSTDVSPALSDVLSAAIAIVGAIVSTLIAGSSMPAVFGLPKASVKLPAATANMPEPSKPGDGVNVAVYVAPVPAKFVSMPPVTATSEPVKSFDTSLNLNVITAVAPAFTIALFAVTVMAGSMASTLIDAGNAAPRLAMPFASVKLPAATVTMAGPP